MKSEVDGPRKTSMKMAAPPSFDRQRKQINTYLKDLIEEKTINEMILNQLTDHAKRMMEVLNRITTPDLFPIIFSLINSSLSVFNQTLIEINCKLEALLNKGLKEWNIPDINNTVSVKQYILNDNQKKLNGFNEKLVIPEKPNQLNVQSTETLNSEFLNANNVKRQMNKIEKVSQSIKEEKKDESVQNSGIVNSMGCERGKDLNISKKTSPPLVDISLQVQDAKYSNAKNKDSTEITYSQVTAVKVKGSEIAQDSVQEKKTNCGSLSTANYNKQKSCPVKEHKKDNKNGKVSVPVKKKKSKGNKCLVTAVNKTSSQDSVKKRKPSMPPENPSKSTVCKKTVNNNVTLEEVNLSINSDYNGKISLAVSPLELYIYFKVDPVRESNVMEKQLKKLINAYEFPASKPKGKTIELRKKAVKEKLGNYALLYSQHDKLFYRLKILDWKLPNLNDLVSVQFVDRGDKMDVSVYDLLPMPKEFEKYPSTATRCHLANFPKKYDKDSRAIEFIRNINKNDVFTIRVMGKKKDATFESYLVMMYDQKENRSLSKMITDFMEIDSRLKWDPMSEAYKSPKNLYALDYEDPATAIYGYVGRDYERVCRFYGTTGKCFKNSCRKEHALLDSKGYTTDKEEVYIRALNCLKIPAHGMLAVRVTHIESPASFYCVMDVPKDNDETLLTLQFSMNENFSAMRKLLIPPGVGQVVVAKYEDRGCYRARVVSVLPEKDKCTLFHVDCGTTEEVHFSQIRAIEPRYLHLPFQAIFCEISGIEENEDTFDLAIDHLNKILKAACMIEVVSILPSEQPHLLVNVFTEQGENVADLMLTIKLVSHNENFLLDNNNTYVPG